MYVCVIHSRLILFQHPHTSGDTNGQTLLMQTPDTDIRGVQTSLHRSRIIQAKFKNAQKIVFALLCEAVSSSRKSFLQLLVAMKCDFNRFVVWTLILV